MKLTLGDVKPYAARAIGMCETDPRIIDMINQACERLLYKGKWQGCYGRYTLATDNGCITWPRQIETIEAIASCCKPGVVRNGWFEFLDSGYGLVRDTDQVGFQLFDRGEVVSYNDMSGETTSHIRVYPDLAADAGKKIILQGYDENGQWIRSLVGGVYIDGEEVTIGLPFTVTTNFFTSLTGVIKDVTNGSVRLYEFETVGSTLTDLAIYEPDETRPVYRRSMLPGLCQSSTNNITVVAKLRHIDRSNDNDWIIPPNREAIKLMVVAIDYEQKRKLEEAAGYEAKAVQALQEQLGHYLGDAVSCLRMANGESWGGGGIYRVQ